MKEKEEREKYRLKNMKFLKNNGVGSTRRREE